MGIKDPVIVEYKEKRETFVLLRGPETFFDAENCLIEFESINDAVNFSIDELGEPPGFGNMPLEVELFANGNELPDKPLFLFNAYSFALALAEYQARYLGLPEQAYQVNGNDKSFYFEPNWEDVVFAGKEEVRKRKAEQLKRKEGEQAKE